MYEDDENLEAIRAAFDRGPHGVTGSGGARPLCGNELADGGIIDTHSECRTALDAAQNEIERSITDREEQRELIDAQQPVIDAAIMYATTLVSDQSPSAKLDAHADLLRSVRVLMQQAVANGGAS